MTSFSVSPATVDDCDDIARLALIAGDGIPAYFWERAKNEGQSIQQYGAVKAAMPKQNFSYENALMVRSGDWVAGMMLGYCLESQDDVDLTTLEPFIRPLIELEQQVPGSWYLNMLAVYEEFRGQGVATALLEAAPERARSAGCSLLSVEVFEQNRNALSLYQKLGFSIAASRAVVPHSCHPFSGQLLLLTRAL